MPDACIFCKIIKKEIPAKIRLENDDFIAFDDINPKASIHVLLIPKKHIHSIAGAEDSDFELIGKMLMTARDLAKELNLTSGYRLVFNNGADSGAEVDHLHLHILGGGKLGKMA